LKCILNVNIAALLQQLLQFPNIFKVFWPAFFWTDLQNLGGLSHELQHCLGSLQVLFTPVLTPTLEQPGQKSFSLVCSLRLAQQLWFFDTQALESRQCFVAKKQFE
jgi:hypothetical protein